MWSRALCLTILLAALCACGPGRADTGIYDPERWSSVEELVAHRKSLRAYDGAPPVIPHEIAGLGRTECNACHQPGAPDTLNVGPVRSHPAWGDCTQCHIERRTTGRFKGSTFDPLWWPATGGRQSAITPPTVPHHLQNRENCTACHIGAQAPAVLRAEHGMRPNCLQCHVAGNN